MVQAMDFSKRPRHHDTLLNPAPDSTASDRTITRRQWLTGVGALGAATLLSGLPRTPASADAGRTPAAPVPLRPLGRTGVQVSMLGLGGAHFIRESEAEGIRLVHEAIDLGVTFFDNAWEYNKTRSEAVMGTALQGRREKVFLMTKVCTHGRGKAVALRQLEQSLRRLRTDYLDLWQIHEVNCTNDHTDLFVDDGAADALLDARRQGKVRFIGFTGHTDPQVHARVLARRFPFDTCQMPLNVFDASFKSFEQLVLPELVRQGIAPIAMKTLCGRGEPVSTGMVRAEEALRYVWSLPVATIVSGMESVALLRQNADLAQRFTPYSPEELLALRRRVAASADGRFEYYKTSASPHCDRSTVERDFQAHDAAGT